MSKLDFQYIEQDCLEPYVASCSRPSDTVRERQRGPKGQVLSGCDRPYFLEKAQEVAGRCSCCGTELRPNQDHCPVCHSVKSRIEDSEVDESEQD